MKRTGKTEEKELIPSDIDLSQSYEQYTVRDAADVLELLYDTVFFSQEDNHERGCLLSQQFRQLLKNALISKHVSLYT